MKDDVIRKYVKDLDGLLRDIKRWKDQPIPNTVYHETLIFYFGMIYRFLRIDDIQFGRPKGIDAAAFWNGRPIGVEFEVFSKNFDHDISDCDLIICWEDNWEDCPIDVLELKYFWEMVKKEGYL